MDSRRRIILGIIAFAVEIFALLAALFGDMTSVPAGGAGKMEQGDNLNDVHTVVRDSDGNIYTLGYTCVQRFDAEGNFTGGAYFDTNSVKHTKGSEFLSLSDGNIVVLNHGDYAVYIYDDGFNLTEKIGVDSSYREDEFYADYPATDAADEEIKLSFFNNTVQTGDEKITLDAPRNRLYSRDVGLLILMASVVLGILYQFKKHE
ncbi:MAG: hypothetical protein LUG52_08085 [Clostridia bacterium]|nr:hypothetical protein [Clostridia bacterium]